MRFTVNKLAMLVLGAEIWISDIVSSGSYNHPLIKIKIGYTDCFGEREFYAWFKFQRHIIGSNDGSRSDRPAQYWTDTARCWTTCYCGRMELDDRVARFHIQDSPFSLDTEDKARVALARKVAKTIDTYNLAHVDLAKDCELVRVVRALDKLKIPCDKIYMVDNLARERIDIWSARQRFEFRANAKRIQQDKEDSAA